MQVSLALASLSQPLTVELTSYLSRSLLRLIPLFNILVLDNWTLKILQSQRH